MWQMYNKPTISSQLEKLSQDDIQYNTLYSNDNY